MTTTHPTEDAFHAILDAHPDDNTTRLVYADWLDENAGEMRCHTCSGCVSPYPDNCPVCHGRGAVSDGRRERAEGYRALALVSVHGPCSWKHNPCIRVYAGGAVTPAVGCAQFLIPNEWRWMIPPPWGRAESKRSFEPGWGHPAWRPAAHSGNG